MCIFPAAAVAALAAVALLPVQGQSQPPFIFKKADLKLLEECAVFDQQLEKRALIYHDDALEKHLNDIAAPLLPTAPLEHVQWRFRILRDPAASAFGLPNGSIYINSGLLARAENDDQVSGRMAQEIAHVANRHPYLFNRVLRGNFVATEAAEVASAIVGGIAGLSLVTSLAGKASGGGILAAVVGYPPHYEQEADESAVQQLKHAHQDPVQLVRLTQILDGRLEPQPVSFWKGQATLKDRIASLKALLGLDHDPGPGIDGGYVNRIRAVLLQNIQLDLDTRRFRSAVAGAKRLAAAYPDDASSLFWLGESYRSLGPRQEHLTAGESTNKGMRVTYRQATQRTEQDEAILLKSTPEGKAALEANQTKSEELFLKAADVDPSLPDTYFGLGSLYEQQGKKVQAIQAYRKYMELCKQPPDIERAKRRLEELLQSSDGVMK